MKNKTETFHIRQVTWHDSQSDLRTIRTQVFIEEQQVPEELEWDEHDEQCIHLLAYDGAGNPIATARMLDDGHIGRMAVVKPWRRQGVGSVLLNQLIEIARQQYKPKVFLNAQTAAVGFYSRHGFTITSDEFLDAGIPHRAMALDLHC